MTTFFKECTLLRTVDISYNPNVTSTAIVALCENSRQLQCLNIQNCPRLCKKSLEALSLSFTTLTSLSLSGAARISCTRQDVVEGVSRCIALKELYLEGTPFESGEFLAMVRPLVECRRVCGKLTEVRGGAEEVSQVWKHCPQMERIEFDGAGGRAMMMRGSMKVFSRPSQL
eukprot:PhF_6_TR9897/c0_g1_i2/m.15089